MRSIRRSLLGYLLLLLGVALGGVIVLVYRFANEAVRVREEAEAKRIEQAFKLRRHEAEAKFDADLLAETKALARELSPKLRLLFGQELGRGPPGSGPNLRPGSARPHDPSLRAPEKEVEDYRWRLTYLMLGTPTGWPATGWPGVATAAVMDPPAGRGPGPGLPRPGLADSRALSP